MTSNEFYKFFKATIDLDINYPLSLSTELSQIALWDSLAVVSLLAEIDVHFNLQLSAEDILKCKTVGDIYKLVENK